MLFALMVGAPGPLTPPPRGAPSTFATMMVVLPDLRQHPPGAHHGRFLALMAGAPRSPAPPPMGPAVDVF
jgi:hypothetical protein